MVTPQQQDLELKKAALGKKSPVIDDLTADDPEIGDEEEVTFAGADQSQRPAAIR
jgi:hypothetical protein